MMTMSKPFYEAWEACEYCIGLPLGWNLPVFSP